MFKKIVGLLIVLASFGGEARDFKIIDFTPNLYATLHIEGCDRSSSSHEDSCSGAGVLKVFNKKDTKPFVVSSSTNFFVELHQGELKSNIKSMPYGEQSLIIYQDFNFDGKKDLAVRNAESSCYGGPAYNIYLAHQGGFKRNADFEVLSNQFCGMFGVDAQNKQLSTMTKSGCCYHEYTDYVVEGNKPVAIKTVYESVNTSLPFMGIETKKRVKNHAKMYSETKTYELNEDGLKPKYFFSFQLINGKTVNLGSLNDLSDGDSIYYALTVAKNSNPTDGYGREVEFYFGANADTEKFSLSQKNHTTQLSFINKNATYIIESDVINNRASMTVTFSGKTFVYPAVLGSVNGSLEKLSRIKTMNVDR